MSYCFTVVWIKGTLNQASDALSRNPVLDPLLSYLGEQDLSSSPAPLKYTLFWCLGRIVSELWECSDLDEQYQYLKQVIL